MKRIAAFTLFICLLIVWPIGSFAGSLSQLVVFGDSLSDTGNVYIATGGAEPAPPAYTAGLFTDGPDSFPSTSGPQGIWIQQLAGMMGLPSPAPYLAGGTNYAFGGALTGYDPTFGSGGEPYVGDQVNLYLAGHPTGVPSNSLYVFWAGANDLFNGVTPQTAVANLTANINTLFHAGAKDFLWLDLPPLGDTPHILSLGPGASAAFNLLSQEYNADWLASIGLLEAQDPGISIIGVDDYSLVLSMINDPSKYGFMNVNIPAQGLNVDPNTYLFWDGVHPTTEGHYQVAKFAYQNITPEPPAAALLGTVLLAGFVAFWWRQRASV